MEQRIFGRLSTGSLKKTPCSVLPTFPSREKSTEKRSHAPLCSCLNALCSTSAPVRVLSICGVVRFERKDYLLLLSPSRKKQLERTVTNERGARHEALLHGGPNLIVCNRTSLSRGAGGPRQHFWLALFSRVFAAMSAGRRDTRRRF